MNFCTHCGATLDEGSAFCTKCGSRADAPAASEAGAAPIAEPVRPALPPSPAVPARSEPVEQAGPVSATTTSQSGCGKIIAVLAVVLIFVVAIGIAGMVYVGYRAKRKLDEIKKSVTEQIATPAKAGGAEAGSGDSGPDPGSGGPRSPRAKQGTEPEGQTGEGILNQLFGDSAPMPMYADDIPDSFIVGNTPVTACPPYSGSFTPPAPPTTLDLAKMPFVPGTILVDAWRRFNGDVEGIDTVTAVEKDGLSFSHSSTGFASDTSVEGTKSNTNRTTCRVDLVGAKNYMTEHESDFPVIFLGTTTFTMPLEMFQQLKTGGKISWNYLEYGKLGAPLRFVPYKWSGELTRVEPGDVPFQVILNDQPVQVPTIHAKGNFEFVGLEKVAHTMKEKYLHHQETEVYVVDNPANPICLLYRQGAIFQVKIVNIKVPVQRPVSAIEQSLKEQKKAVVYGIFFDFDKDTIKPESEPVLKEIAKAMADNPDWKLNVGGHTDNIGGDAHNLDLSKRRAASVKTALVERFHISPDRLATDGFGSAGPIDSNDTLEGRARNRRVELSRE